MNKIIRLEVEALRKKIIFALDVETNEVENWVSLLKNHIGLFKVGGQLFTQGGPSVVSTIKRQGGSVFLDLKYHDIPSTVARIAEEATKLGVTMYNLHALGGLEMMQAALFATKSAAERLGVPTPIVLAVTILTSMDRNDLSHIGIPYPIEDEVLRLALLAKRAGLDGVVASPKDVHVIRKECGDDFIVVTPGIRMTRDIKDDQKRASTPREAIKAGADFIVIGRPIRQAKNPIKAIENIVRDMK